MFMTPRERLLSTLNFEPLDRPFRMESLGFWNETVDRWHKEGLPADINNQIAIHVYNENDMMAPVFLGAHEHPGFDPLFEDKIIEKNEKYIIKRDMTGSVVKIFTDGSSTPPTWLDYPVKDMKSWGDVKSRLEPGTAGRIAPYRPMIDLAISQPWPLNVYIPGLFGTHRHLLGFQNLMLAYYEQPELLHEIARQWVKLWKGEIERIAEKRVPDLLQFWEDMCYRNGPMIGPKTFGEFMSPYYKELVSFFRNELKIPGVSVDTDGNLTVLIPKFVEAGINCLMPFEVNAGMDVLRVREQWPTEFVIWGGINKLELAKDREAIKAEVMRVVPPMLEKRGYVPSIDHAVQPEVPFDNWKYFIELVRGVGEQCCK